MTRLRAVPAQAERAVIYLRQSTHREESISLELQRTAAEDHCARQGYEVVAVLADPGISGRTFKRPAVTKAMALIEAGDAQVLVLWKWSRLSRSRRDWALAADRVEVAGGRVESATEAVDVSTSTGRLTRGMLTEIAAWESERLGEQWKETQDRRRRQGLPHSGQPRFGYTYVRGQGYAPHPEQGPLLAELYRRYLAGDGHTTLARWLNARGVPPMGGSRKGWSVQAVIRMLDSGFGAGLLVQPREGTWLPAAHEPVITAGEWEAYRLQRRVRWDQPARVRQPAYRLTGLVKCGQCGLAMVASADGQRGAGYMYRCTGRTAYGTCPGVWVTRAQVERKVLEWLAERAAEGVDERARGKAARVAALADRRAERKALQRELLDWDRRLERARGFLVDGTLTRAEYGEEKARVDVRRAEVEKRLDETTVDAGALAAPDRTTVATLVRDWETLAVKDCRDLLAQLVWRVEVWPGERGDQDVRVRRLSEKPAGV